MELVAGYGVYLTQRQLDEAINCSSTTKLIRNLMRVFFSREVLASSVLGKCSNPALDKHIVSACIHKLDKNSAVDPYVHLYEQK